MNRKDRRAAIKHRANVLKPPADGAQGAGIADLAAEAGRLYQQRRLVEAEVLCRQILYREPAHVQSLNLLGLIAQDSGAHKLAVKRFVRALDADGLNAACHYNIANSYQSLGRRAEAGVHFKKAIAFGSNDRGVEALIMQSPVIAAFTERISRKWPLPISNEELFGQGGLPRSFAIQADAHLSA